MDNDYIEPKFYSEKENYNPSMISKWIRWSETKS